MQPPNNSGGKLSYKDKYALETLPKRIAALENEITSQNEILADNGLFERDRIAFEAAVLALAQRHSSATERIRRPASSARDPPASAQRPQQTL